MTPSPSKLQAKHIDFAEKMGNPGEPPSPPPSRPAPPPPPTNEKHHYHQQRSTLNSPQSFPPQQDLYTDGVERQPYPPPQHHHSQPYPPPQEDAYTIPVKPHAYPPPQDHGFPVEPQAFPPPHEDEVVAFPPPPNTHFQQPNNAMPFSPTTNYVSPAHGGVPVGQPFNPMAAQSSPFNQPIKPAAAVATEGWKSELFDCMNDPQNAVITALFPCVTFGQIAEIVDTGHTSCGTSGMMYGVIAFCIAIPCILSCTYRTKLRNKYGLIETPAPDWAVHCFCEWCALCQEYRELKERGLDPAIGWQGNQAAHQQQQQFPMAAPVGQRMM